jgi:hypothetical protein
MIRKNGTELKGGEEKWRIANFQRRDLLLMEKKFVGLFQLSATSDTFGMK